MSALLSRYSRFLDVFCSPTPVCLPGPQVAELKAALDETSGFEQMLEELTEQHAALGEREQQARAMVDGLQELLASCEDVRSKPLLIPKRFI